MRSRNDRSGVKKLRPHNVRRADRRPVTFPRASVVVPIAFLLGGLAGCSSSDEAAPPTSTPVTTNAPASTTTSPAESSSTAPTTTTATTTSGPASLTLRCDADSSESPIFEVPLGTSVTLVATSSIEREYHLHGYDIELTGQEVTFQFTADLPGPHELTEHPDHSTVCTIVS